MLLLHGQKKTLRVKVTDEIQKWAACPRMRSATTDCHERRREEVCPVPCSLFLIMFRAAVRLSVSGVRSLTSTRPGSRGIS